VVVDYGVMVNALVTFIQIIVCSVTAAQRQPSHFLTVEEEDLNFIIPAVMVGLVEVEHHLGLFQGEGEDTLEGVLTRHLITITTPSFSQQAVAVRLFPEKRGMRSQEHAPKGMVT